MPTSALRFFCIPLAVYLWDAACWELLQWVNVELSSPSWWCACMLELESTLRVLSVLQASLKSFARQSRCHTETIFLRDTDHAQEEHAAEEQPAAEEQLAEHSADDSAENAKDGESEGGDGEPEEEEEAKPEITVRDLFPISLISSISGICHLWRNTLPLRGRWECWHYHVVSGIQEHLFRILAAYADPDIPI